MFADTILCGKMTDTSGGQGGGEVVHKDLKTVHSLPLFTVSVGKPWSTAGYDTNARNVVRHSYVAQEYK